jgi:hypothetical protein
VKQCPSGLEGDTMDDRATLVMIRLDYDQLFALRQR